MVPPMKNQQNTDALIAEITRDAQDNDGLKSVTLHKSGDLTVRYVNGYSNTYFAEHPANKGISFREVVATLRKQISK